METSASLLRDGQVRKIWSCLFSRDFFIIANHISGILDSQPDERLRNPEWTGREFP